MTTTLILSIALAFVILLVGGFTIFSAVINFVGASESVKDRLETYATLPEFSRQSGLSRSQARFLRLRLRIDRFLAVFASRRLNNLLLSANWSITITEFILIRFGATLLGFLIGWGSFRNLLPGVGLAVLAYITPGLLLRRSLRNRQVEFSKQLIDVLVLITGAVRAGYSLLQALDMVVREARPPASEEFRRVTREVGLGFSISDALNNLNTRMENDDLYLVITAININTQVGGNLATMLEAVTETIRERMRLFGEIRVQTTHQRFTGFILSLMPFIIGAVLFILNPNYMEGLFEITCIPVVALIGVILGNIIIRRMVKIKI